ncbi:MAG: peptidylprolyl isomerase [Eubacterium sp.]|nr:peptidylprolyl isomerase [Eubacterium sp.]
MNKSKKIIKEQGLAKPDKKEQKKVAKSRKNLILIIIGLLFIAGGIFVVCYTQLRPRTILTVEGPGKNGENETKTVYYTDAMYNIYSIENMYNTYGMDWDKETGDKTTSESAKDSIMDEMKEREILLMQAEKDGTVLDDNDKKEVEETVKTTMEKMPDKAKNMKGLSEDDVRKAVTDQKLAEKQKDVIIKGLNIDENKIKSGISKTDYRQYTLQYYMISKKPDSDESSDSSEGASGSAADVKSDADLKKAKADIEALRKQALTASDFSKLITDSDKDSKDDKTGAQFADHNLLEKDTDFLDEAGRKLVKSMKNDEISKVIETDDGYYFVKMINNNDPAGYDKEVENQLKTEQNTQYENYYKETLSKQYTTTVGDYWKQRVEIGHITC